MIRVVDKDYDEHADEHEHRGAPDLLAAPGREVARPCRVAQLRSPVPRRRRARGLGRHRVRAPRPRRERGDERAPSRLAPRPPPTPPHRTRSTNMTTTTHSPTTLQAALGVVLTHYGETDAS